MKREEEKGEQIDSFIFIVSCLIFQHRPSHLLRITTSSIHFSISVCQFPTPHCLFMSINICAQAHMQRILI